MSQVRWKPIPVGTKVSLARLREVLPNWEWWGFRSRGAIGGWNYEGKNRRTGRSVEVRCFGHVWFAESYTAADRNAVERALRGSA